MHSFSYFQALSDETRLRCFRVLASSPVSLCVAELVDIVQKAQYSISHSLAELRKAELVLEDRQGKLVFYSPNFNGATGAAIKELSRWVINHCECHDLSQAAKNKNNDGSSRPGNKTCGYDHERLQWRLAMRNDGKVVYTYRQQSSLTKTATYKARVLFVCTHNAARSQIASAYLRQLAPDSFEAQSAGIEPGQLNPYVIKVLAEQSIDISANKPRSVAEVYQNANTYDYVITVCSPEAEADCPVFPGPVQRLSWPFADPSKFTGTEEEIMQGVRSLCHKIKGKIEEFIDEQS